MKIRQGMAHKQKDFYKKIADLFLTNLGIIIGILARVTVIRVLKNILKILKIKRFILLQLKN